MNRLLRAVMAMCIAMLIVPAALAQDVTLTGAGASFPYPFYAKLFSEYNKAHPDVKINYSSVGSGTGIKQISDRSIEFGASDAPMTDAQLTAALGGALLRVPTALGAVVPIYNVPHRNKPLLFSGALLAGIFRGR